MFGTCINTTVRVCSQAAAESVLVTELVKQLAQGHFAFGNGKVHKLKGIEQPITLFDFPWREITAS